MIFSMKNQVILFYKYTRINDPEALRIQERARCERLDLAGRMIIAHEGINGTYEGTIENTEQYIKELTKSDQFKDVQFKKSSGTGKSFPKLSIRVRPEIVSLHLDGEDFNPTDFTAPHLSADELHTWYENNDDFVVIDMRNDYEHWVGHFEKSVLPNLENFRDLPKILPELEHLKDKKVLTVCTGGVRCEKASGYLLKHGFKDVHQLDGGIVTYMEKYPTKNFRGAMYVFDQRSVIDYDNGEHEIISVCSACGDKTERYLDCEYQFCGAKALRCDACMDGGNTTCSKLCKLHLRILPTIKKWRTIKRDIKRSLSRT